MTVSIDSTGKIYPISKGVTEKNKLDPGWYELHTPWGHPHFAMKLDKTGPNEKFVFGNPSVFSKLRDEIKLFMGAKQKYSDLGIVHRRGYMLYGPPGTGKSAIVKSLEAEFVKLGGVVVDSSALVNGAATALMIQMISASGCPVMCSVDEFDVLEENYDDEETLAKLLDGTWMQAGVETFTILATTNNVNSINTRFSERPGRFDRVIKVDKIDRSSFDLICKKLDISKYSDEIYKSVGGIVTPAIMSEIAVRLRVFGQPIKAACADFKRKKND